MRTCSHCGKEYPDDVAQCSSEGGASTEALPPPLPSSQQAPVPAITRRVLKERQLRIIELVLVCVVVFGGSILSSAYSLFGGSLPAYGGSLRWVSALVREFSALGLIWYVLLRRSKNFTDLGFGWKWTDIPWSILLFVAGSMLVSVVYRIIYYAGFTSNSVHAASASVRDYLFGGGIFISTLIMQFVNPFFEELIVRAYVMTEVREITGVMAEAVACSVLIQMSYHFYQGAPLAIAEGAQFLLWSLFYAKTHRITPVILAHLYADVGATLWYYLLHR